MTSKAKVDFVEARSDNLPKLDSFMVADFFANNPMFTSAEIRGVKADLSGRSSYGDNAIGYVQLKRQNFMCIVEGKICPEHKVRKQNYEVSLTINEKEQTIVNGTCNGCAASLGGCKHIIAFIMWVHRRSEEPSTTDVECYWRKPKLSRVGTELKCISLEEMGKVQKLPLPLMSNGEFLREFIREGIEKEVSSQILKYFHTEKSLKKLGLHQLLTLFSEGRGRTAEEFLEFAEQQMSADECYKACDATSDQSKSTLWHQLRYGRVTASRLYEVARCKTVSGTLVENIVGSLKIKETVAMQRGKVLEKTVIPLIEEKLGIKLKHTGLLLNPQHPYLGASPDAYNDDYVVEIKCPSTSKTLNLYLKDGEITTKCRAQICLQMMLFRKSKGIFCVADPSFEINKKLHIKMVEYEDDFIQPLIQAARHFWCNNIFNVLLSSLI
ncbi:hypothetical protein FQR65_LT14460 [Abscondita terminalis]|nr:hypothetical protein FQR65_LT14460 [Abscondita terminalis]